ncbi:MAG TPA: hypothetical protein VFI22_00115, partial [Thermomicrobiales bacterium]|nr:hypothetical protein [Thermomicrobiales bacterium]
MTGESGYKIERSTDGTNFTQIGSVTANVTAYHDLTVSGSGLYSYRVRATNGGGDSLPSNISAAAPIQPPAAPANLSATSISGTEIDLSWGDVAGESGFKIERSTDGTNFTPLASVAAGVLTYKDTTVSGSTLFYYRVRATNSGGDSQPSNVAVMSAVQPPAAPANLVATPISGTEIDLAWGNVTGESSFKIGRSIDGTNFTPLTTVPADVLTYADTTVSGAGVYYYRVIATNSGGDSAPSNVASTAPVQPPAAPTNLDATPISGTEIDLAWSNVAGEAAYLIERSTNGTNFTSLASVGADVITYKDQTVSGAQTYYYRVKAQNSGGSSSPSNVASTMPIQPPAAPANLTATPVSGTEIDLAWSDVATESGFRIERSTDGTNFSVLGNVPGGVLAYSDKTVLGAIVYSYRIVAINSGGNSLPSNVASATPIQPPAAPANLTATPVSGTEIDLAWSDVANESGFQIERSTNGTNFTALASVGAAVTSYHDTTVAGAVTYFYRVEARNVAGNSLPSNIASSAPVQPPAAPANLVATAISGTEIDLAWGDVSGETGFRIERSTDGTNFTTLATRGAGVLTYKDLSVSGSGLYSYRVIALSSGGDSLPSNVASSAPVQPPAAPTNLIATPISATEIDLVWSDVAGETGFRIERSTNGTNFTALASVSAGVTSYHDTTVSGSVVYSYRIIATNSGGNSLPSNVAASAPVQPPAAPSNLLATPISGTEIDLAWSDVAGETGFKIERSTDGVNFSQLATVA